MKFKDFKEAAAIVYHNGAGSPRRFPFLIGFGWRDSKGFNPGIIYMVHQTGSVDPHLLPLGHRTVGWQWHLFGSRF